MQFNRACDNNTSHKDIWHNTISYYIFIFILIHVLDSITTLLSFWSWISDSSDIDTALDTNKNKEITEASDTFLKAAKLMISALLIIN